VINFTCKLSFSQHLFRRVGENGLHASLKHVGALQKPKDMFEM